jgi:hypothetical protein
MTAFDEPFWNLAQAAAWVAYRETELVEQLANADEAAFTAIGFYPTMWPAGRTQYAQLSELHRALIEGRLASKGYHEDRPSKLTEIPREDWQDLNLRPPYAFDQRYPGRRHEPWTHIRVVSADVKRLWRSTLETAGRTKFDWPAIRVLYEQARKTNPKFSQNQLIEEVQLAYQQKYNKEPPSRTAFQRHIPEWK